MENMEAKMGLIASSCSFTRFKVKEALPADYRERYAQEIRRYGFREIDETTDVERSAGWVNIMNVLDYEFIGEEFFKGEFIALSLRIDTRRVPSNVLKQHCRKAEEERKASLGKEFLSKAERQEIRDMVKLQLLKRAIPNTRTFDMIWEISNGQILFSSLNEANVLEFQELFKKTFNLNLEQLFPYTIAQSKLNEEQKVSLEQIFPANFVQNNH